MTLIIIASILFGIVYSKVLIEEGGIMEGFDAFIINKFGSKDPSGLRIPNRFTNLFSCGVCMSGQCALWLYVINLDFITKGIIVIFTAILITKIILKKWQ